MQDAQEWDPSVLKAQVVKMQMAGVTLDASVC